MDVNKRKRKLKQLFDKLFEKNFELSSYYSEKLLKYLSDDAEQGVGAGKILDTPFFSNLLLHSLTDIENATNSVKIFITELFTVVLKNELLFSKLSQQPRFQLLVQKVSIFNSNPPITLLLAGLKAITAYTAHYSGIMQLVQYKVWTHLLRPDVQQKPVKVAQSIYNVISQIVWKLNEYDEEVALMEILVHVVEPIRSNIYVNLEVMDAENESMLYDPILPFIKTIVTIVKDYDKHSSQKRVLRLLQRHFTIDYSLHFIIEKTRNPELVTLVCEYCLYFFFGSAKDYISSGVEGKRDIPLEIISEYYNIILCLLDDKKMPSAAMDFAIKCVAIWVEVDTSLFPETFERHGRTYNLRNQFITLVLTPLVTYTFLVGSAGNYRELTELQQVYGGKLITMNTEHILKAAYSLRAVVETNDIKKTVIKYVKEILKLKNCLNITQAGMLYQALYYTLKIHVILDGTGNFILNENPLKSFDDVKLLSLVLEAITMLLKKYDINWYETLEIICLQTTLIDILKQNFLPSKQLIQAVDLIDLCIKKFLSPDLVLLMESRKGSTLNEMGAIMKAYIQHEEWEVRDSALQLLLTCTEVGYVKYTPLRKLILENNLLIPAANVALHDTEFYAQATALKCLAAATKIDGIWSQMLIAHPNLYIHLIHIIRHNSEGIVRKEAVNVLTQIYVNQKLSNDFVSCLFNVMAAAALNDLHWEVQVAALNFWRNTIQNKLSNRGVIDGKFPSVTFSKEKRKIVVLNDREIMKQLIGIMNDLSHIGCLTVLHKCLIEEISIDVMEQSYFVTKDLIKILDYYNFDKVPQEYIRVSRNDYDTGHDKADLNIEQYIEEAMDLSTEPTRYQMALRAKITEDLINTNDHDLIEECYRRCNQISSSENTKGDLILSPLENLIDPNQFLTIFKETDYLKIIDCKKKWNSGQCNLDSLLDEMLALERSTEFTTECN